MSSSIDNLTDQLDRKRLLQFYEDDTEMMISAMEMFLDEVIPNFLELEKLVEQQDWEALTSLTHQMRPWLGMVGLTLLENKLCDIETMAKQSPNLEIIMISCTNFNENLAQMSSVLKMELAELSNKL
ncbi:Hpt domain-containing protein [Larkinella rosea]|uniref:Hpt domain-containing protein n=1 Tax=Larkinella rosea TaxID=2025312 RepID=A0A3P1BJH4_9BACT|nr:Hpt domain-containing protein [Larkinella rosea]RRB01251.1 Hpt domain-containing protein [Larkinella rosea]